MPVEFAKSTSSMVGKTIRKPIFVRLLFAGILFGASMLIALLLAEGILRFAPDLLPVEVQHIITRNPSNYGVAHPYIGHLQTPNNALVISGRDFHAVHHTDGYGFRNRWPWPETAQILALGDSEVFSFVNSLTYSETTI